MITSAQNPKVKLARALLGRPKERRQGEAFVAEGIRLVEEAAASGWPFRFGLYSESLSERGQELVSKLRSRGTECELVAEHLLQSLSDTGNSQGLVAVLDLALLPLPQTLNFVIIPDQIRDPGNLGTLLRTAAAAGVQAALIPPETTDPFAPKVVRAGMGAHFRLPIQPLAWDAIRRISGSVGLHVFLADMQGTACWEIDLRSPLALIVGGEAEGASVQASELANVKISIPMPGGSESLNAGVAGAVLMFEVVRQRRTL
ncbi:MAG: RNA methyltransferase [Anaerolineales bacterium]|nr:RNA methyltransferase [Anaerolineales bacterium]